MQGYYNFEISSALTDRSFECIDNDDERRFMRLGASDNHRSYKWDR
jgi:hypothetical protein